jgi:hypothetical protein
MQSKPHSGKSTRVWLVCFLFLMAIIFIVVILFLAAFRITNPTPSVKTRIFVELGSIDLACRAFKEKYGDYPPDGSDQSAISGFLARAFPDYKGELPPRYKITPTSALLFWLGGMRDADGKFIGFSANPENPFDNDARRLPPFFEFDLNRVKDDAEGLRYLPGNDNAESEPYVYFRARPDGSYAGSYHYSRPCLDTTKGANVFCNPGSFQIRSPGKDGKYGSGIMYPTGEDYDKYQYDDQANFCPKLSFEGAIK